MGNTIRFTICSILELFNLGWFEYYKEWNKRLSIHFYCRRNKYTNRKYFRTMKPIAVCGGYQYDYNEWIEYDGNLDDNLI